MPYLVNGQIVPEELIAQESARIARDPRWQSIKEDAARAQSLHAAAEYCAQDRILIEQAAADDPRPIDSHVLEEEIRRQRVQMGRGITVDENQLRRFAERCLRLQRTNGELVAGASKATPEQVQAFYEGNRDHMRRPELFHAAHIVKYINPEQSKEKALEGIKMALAELERGEPFSVVADRHSDCGDRAGDLGQFPAGYMVAEFEDAIRILEPGQRTGIFSTPFGFHIAILFKKSPIGVASLEEVSANVEEVLNFANQHEAYTSAVATLRARAEIQWIPESQAAAS